MGHKLLSTNKEFEISHKHFNSGYTLGMYFTSYNRYKRYDRYANFRCLSFLMSKSKNNEPPQFLSTHPSSKNRIANLKNWINEVIIKYPPIKT